MTYEANNIYNVNCYEAIKHIPDKSVDLIITDPPYEIETDGGSTNIGQSIQKGLMQEIKDLKIQNGIDFKILDEFMRVMKKPNIYIWCNKKQILDYMNFFVGKHECSFEIMVWLKNDPTPLCGGNYLIDKEFCLYFRKGVKLNTKFETAKTFWIQNKNIIDKKRFNHPTIKPLKIIKTLIENSSNENDLVLDVFLGSGTTAVAAKEVKRKYIGFEISEEYFQIAVNRLNKCDANGQQSLFLI